MKVPARKKIKDVLGRVADATDLYAHNFRSKMVKLLERFAQSCKAVCKPISSVPTMFRQWQRASPHSSAIRRPWLPWATQRSPRRRAEPL